MSMGEFAAKLRLPRSFVEKNNLMEKAREQRKNSTQVGRKTQAESRSRRRESQRVEQEKKRVADEAAERARTKKAPKKKG